MKNYSKDLKKGARLISRRKYTRAIRFLEPKVPLFLEDDNFYFLLGLAIYRTGDMGGARFYFERGLQSNRENMDLRLMLAMTHLRRKDSAAAAKTWLTVLEADPKNRRAERGLEVLRRMDTEKDLNDFIESGRHKRLLPPFRERTLNPLLLLVPLLAILLAGGLYLLIPRLSERQNEPQRDELNYIDMDISGIPVTDSSGSFHYVLTVDEVNATYNRAIELFDNEKDNMCQVEINRLMNSNASGALKSRLSTLEGYLKKPDYSEFYTNYTFAQVNGDPLLYENCWVLWRGRVSNLEITEERISFLFLVGFENETFLEGSLPVYVDYGVKIDRELPVEVMGRIVREGSILVLKADTIRHILPQG